jgi:hypothetical protein
MTVGRMTQRMSSQSSGLRVERVIRVEEKVKSVLAGLLVNLEGEKMRLGYETKERQKGRATYGVIADGLELLAISTIEQVVELVHLVLAAEVLPSGPESLCNCGVMGYQ